MIRGFLTILGILAGVYLLAVGIMYFNAHLFDRNTKKEIRMLKASINDMPKDVLKVEDFAHLPEPVIRYLNFAQVIDKKPIRYISMHRKGKFRMNEEQKWMALKGKIYFSTDPPAFVRDATMDAGFVSFCVRDKYFEGKANLLGKLFGAFTIVNENNHEVDRTSLLRYLADAVWFPTAFLSPDISWKPIDEIAAKATISHSGHTISATFFFEPSGAISHIYATDLFRNHALENWSCLFRDYTEINGFMVPAQSEIMWNLDSGDFSYAVFDVKRLKYE